MGGEGAVMGTRLHKRDNRRNKHSEELEHAAKAVKGRSATLYSMHTQRTCAIFRLRRRLLARATGAALLTRRLGLWHGGCAERQIRKKT